jgi:CrcB protein
MMPILASVAAGGALGAMARYLVGHWAVTLWGTAFPWGTLLVNVAGSFAMALAAFWLVERGVGSPALRAFAITGVLGGFTTFSAFSLDALSLFERGEVGLAGLYVAASVILSLGACAGGFALIRAVS